MNIKQIILETITNKLTSSKLHSILNSGSVTSSVKLARQGHDSFDLWPAGKGYNDDTLGKDDPSLNNDKVKDHHRIQLMLGDDMTFFKKDLGAHHLLEPGEESLQKKKEQNLADKISKHLNNHGIKHHYEHDEDNFPMIYVPVNQGYDSKYS